MAQIVGRSTDLFAGVCDWVIDRLDEFDAYLIRSNQP